jgi:hypothetical protein
MGGMFRTVELQNTYCITIFHGVSGIRVCVRTLLGAGNQFDRNGKWVNKFHDDGYPTAKQVFIISGVCVRVFAYVHMYMIHHHTHMIKPFVFG